MTEQPASAGEAVPTVTIDPVAAYFKRRMEAAEAECLMMAAKLRDQDAVMKRLLTQVRALLPKKDGGAEPAPEPAKPRPKPRKPAGNDAAAPVT